jgi:hypothetical protein
VLGSAGQAGPTANITPNAANPTATGLITTSTPRDFSQHITRIQRILLQIGHTPQKLTVLKSLLISEDALMQPPEQQSFLPASQSLVSLGSYEPSQSAVLHRLTPQNLRPIERGSTRH